MTPDILGYRDWAKELAKTVSYVRPMHYHQRLSLLCPKSVVFAVGWSTLIPEEFYSNRDIFVLHPSPLPKYRGGSPIQHQLLAGETASAVSIFKLDINHPSVDSGPIVFQKEISLDGQMCDILDRIVKVGAEGIVYCMEKLEDDSLEYRPQEEGQATSFKRRLPSQSKITLKEVMEEPAWKLDAKIRGLQDPYPNAFIVCGDGKKLYLTGSHL